MADGDPIEQWHLADDFFDDLTQSQLSSQPLEQHKASDVQSMTSESIQEIQQQGSDEMIECYKQCKGNITKTAKALGVSRNTLYKKLRELGLK